MGKLKLYLHVERTAGACAIIVPVPARREFVSIRASAVGMIRDKIEESGHALDIG